MEPRRPSSVSIRVASLLIGTPEFLSQQGCVRWDLRICISSKVPGETAAARRHRTLRTADTELGSSASGTG